MVTATYGTATFYGLRSKQRHSVDFYIADVVGTQVKFGVSGPASATASPFFKAPEPMVLQDLSIVTGPTVMVGLKIKADDAVIPGKIVRIANFLNTLTTRPALGIGFAEGTNVGFEEF